MGAEYMNPGADPQIEPYIDISEAAEFLRRSHKTIRAWARAGSIPAYPIGTGPKPRCLFLRSELDKWVRSRKLNTQESIPEQLYHEPGHHEERRKGQE
jgi:excisionase family DNA binding protein